MRRKGLVTITVVLFLEVFAVGVSGQAVVFDTPSSAVIWEHPAEGTMLAQLTALDAESSGSLTFDIRDANFRNNNVTVLDGFSSNNSFYSVNLLVGSGGTGNAFDYEDRQTVQIEVGATNANGESAMVSVTIHLMDINDNAPTFDPVILTVYVPENTAPNSVITTYTATDPDTGFGGAISYRPTNYDEELFSVSSVTGEITLLQNLDYESAERQYRLTIIALDFGSISMSSTGEVIVNVMDFNDHNPQFELDSYNVQVYENLTVGNEVLLVSAYDGDQGIDDDLMYTIIPGQGSDTFAINPSTGNITLARPLNREVTAEYQLTVEVREVMSSNSRNSTQVVITILDINDNRPSFPQRRYEFCINETTPVGVIITTIAATDPDEEHHAQLTYTIKQSVPFNVDSNGAISVANSLDYETMTSYTFQLCVEEDLTGVTDSADTNETGSGAAALLSSTMVHIELTNHNDESPVFLNTPYNITLLEHSRDRIQVALLEVYDRDDQSGDFIELVLLNYNNIFELVNNSEILVGNSLLLDYEESPQYIIHVMATDMGNPPLSSTVAVIVNLINDNDNVPNLPCPSFSLRVEENSPMGHPIAALNATDADEDQLNYMISANDSSPVGVERYFSFSNGQLVTSSMRLNYEMVTEAILHVIITDSDPNHQGECSYNISVIDLNDNSPTFTESLYHFSVLENSVQGTLIGTVNATDLDSEQFGTVEYRLTGNSTMVTINSTSGELSVNQPLDRESISSFIVQVEATDDPQSGDGNRVTTTVNVTVDDDNDNDPVFDRARYETSVSEAEGNFTFAVRATDQDIDNNAQLTYSILSSNVSIAELLIIGQTDGVIRKPSAATFDRETTGNIQLTIVAYDNGIPRRNGTTEVLIVLLDVNDNPPEFTNPLYSFDVYENVNVGDIVGQVIANDPDHGSVMYRLGEDALVPFNIDQVNPGNIVVSQMLNRERIPIYTFSVVAMDMDHSTSTQVTINVLDVNDNPPRFTQRLYSTRIREDTPVNNTILIVTATDGDVEPNNFTCYKLLGQDGTTTPSEISINNSTGEVTVSLPLDYDSGSTTIAVIVNVIDAPDCEPSGTKFEDTVSLVVTLIDVNDNVPKFAGNRQNDDGSFTVEILEGTSQRTLVDTGVNVTDADDGLFGSISVTANSTDNFAVSLVGRSLQLLVITELNRELISQYIIAVNASDGGGRTELAILVVNIVDINEAPPVFTQEDYEVHIEEREYQQEVIYTSILAEDIETGGDTRVMYSLHNPPPFFSINESSGAVIANGVIDREMNASFVLTVIASETQDLMATTTLTIIVDDVNDNLPIILSCSNNSVSETDVIGSVLFRVMAQDADADDVLSYMIEDSSDTFNITDTGEIITNVILDYDEGVRQYNFSLTVSDSSNDTSADCRITLVDSNDNTPQFTPGCCGNVTIPESTTIGTILPVNISATDADSDSNGEVVLSAIFQFIDKFDLVDNQIVVTGALDYETTPVYELVIQAADSVPNPRTANITIFVQLINENDNDPTFNRTLYTFSMNEHSPNGTIVGQIFVSDADRGPVSLRVLDAPFAIDDDGILITDQAAQLFDYDSPMKHYNFSVLATDDGNQTGTTMVVVSLNDINDNNPVFSQNYSTTLAAGSYSNQPFLSLTATDKDSTSNAHLTYSISPAESGFSIDRLTGLLTVTGLFNINMTYTLLVRAEDDGDPPLNGTATVTINVMDLNVGDLQFINQPYITNITESLSIGAEVLMVMASASAIPRYFLATNMAQFSVNPMNGTITMAQRLDYETDGRTYIFTVAAVDTSMANTALATVTINLLDVNDNGPRFLDRDGLQVSIAENSNISTLIYTFSTVDDDSPIYSNTGYTIMQADTLFTVNAEGQLLLNGSLDREVAASYPVTIVAYDVDDRTLNSSIDVTIIVLDSNDHYPVFSQPYYTASITENTMRGVSVLTVTASDQDVGDNGDIIFTIMEGDGDEYFIINTLDGCKGTIFTSSIPADRELYPIINLTILASDRSSSPNINTTTVVINLMDINDNAPNLTTPGPFPVIENVTTGPLLTLDASDADLPANGYGLVTYLLDHDFDGLFSLNSSNGELVLTNTLDRENVSSYNLTVILQDTPDDDNVNQAIFSVTIDVVDINDNPPQFSALISTPTISEEADQGTVVVNLTATDIDEGSNAVVTIIITNIAPNNPIEPFRIVPADSDGTVNVVVNNRLDRETAAIYNVTVQAQDMGNPSLSSTMSFNVLVQDANDNVPTFTMETYSFTVSEDVAVNYLVATLSANDMDDNELMYGFASPTDVPFSILSDGGIIVESGLDRDIEPTMYTFRVDVRDGVNLPDVADVMITVLDVNDNPPVFTQAEYYGTIEEGSFPSVPVTIDPQIEASDADAPNTFNSEIVYELLNDMGSNYFRLEVENNVVRLEVSTAGHNNLDYEDETQYRLRVHATDRGSPQQMTSTVVVVINVVDINDNAPTFTRDQYQHSVIETAVNGSLDLLTISANDEDTDEVNGGGVTYAISAGNTNLFAINNETGELSAIADLDADLEDSRQHTLTVVATDRRSPFNSGSVSVLVYINDLNDNAPQFNASQFLASVSETAPGIGNSQGVYVTTIGVTDADTGNNSRLSLTLSTDKFSIHPNTFQLFTNPLSTGVLDREVDPVEQFTLTACDNGMPERQCNNVTVSITLLDVNDNSPQFDLPNVTLTIRQSQLVNSVIAVIVADDGDIGSNAELRYSISTNEHGGLFRVDPLTGSVILNQSIDASLINSSIDLTVTAVDQGTSPLTGSSVVTVIIVGETGLVPVFDESLYNVSVFEGRDPGQHVVNVSAMSSASSNIVYSIEFPSEGFMIDSTLGIITTTITLNREDSETYSVSVRAANEEAHTFALVFVRVTDANDHYPQFDRVSYTFDVMENNDLNYTVGPITATDLDSGSNAELEYTIVAGDLGNFIIDPFDGSLIATESLDREDTPSYTLTVNVSDNGNPSLSNSTIVTITVLDENDNSPELQDIAALTILSDSVLVGNTASSVIIPENHPTYTSFIRLDVVDHDNGANSALMYSIVQSPASNNPVFVVDPYNGELQNRNELDYDEGVNNYSLAVTVTDMGAPSRRNLTHTVIVTVSDINDCVPDFGVTSIVVLSLPEEQDNGTFVRQFTATDCDSGNNSLLDYSVSGGNGHFTINSTGHLTTNAVLDRENISSYNLVITATDNGLSPLRSSIQLEVELADINDNTPQFSAPTLPYHVRISESVPESATITTITANDADMDSVVSYSISDPNNVFAISSDTGVVTLQQLLDREMADEYNLTITATDGTRSNTTRLIVTVEDVNDNSPVFTDASCTAPMRLREHTNETFVRRVSATDSDDGDNSRIMYSFLGRETACFSDVCFTINTTSGEIFVGGNLDHEVQAVYNLIVRAEDQATSGRRETVCTLNVEVDDINDHAPEFVPEMFVGSVLENLLTNIDIVTVSATDQDRTHPNNAIQYSFSDQPQPAIFMINATSGAIRNIVPLDKEDVNCSVYNLTVVATNALADPPLSGSVPVMITVVDVNEFEPSFVPPTPDRVYVREYSHPEDIPVLRLFADDDDCSLDVVFLFSLLTRIANSPFSLDQNTGQLFLRGTLDYEQTENYTLMFQVSDGDLTGNTTVVVHVVDENDNAPSFTNLEASIREGINGTITTLNIVDDDHDDSNTDSIVQLVSAIGQSTINATDHFSLDPITGELSAIVPLDRETDESFVLNITITNTRSGVGCTDTPNTCSSVNITSSCAEPDSYHFTTDGACVAGCGGSFTTITECVEECVCKLTSTKQLLVTVTDINDNSPIFNRSQYDGAITTTTEIGQNVLTVEATDLDVAFGPVVYEIVRTGPSDDSSRFTVERSTGVIVTAASFVDDAGKQFQFTVEARDHDGANGYNSGQAQITVAVLDDLQRVVITFQCGVVDLLPQANTILMALENITGYLIRVEEIGPHFVRNSVTGVRLERNDSYTDLVFHAVDIDTSKIVEGEDVIRVLVHNIDQLENVLINDCKVDSAKPIQELLVASQEDLSSLQFVLIVLAAIIGLGGVLMLCLSYRQRYVGTHLKRERYMADIFYGPGETIEEHHKVTSTTENFEMVGEQPITQNKPIMMQPYSDWSQPVKENIRPSASKQTLQRDNPLYESQEIRMEMFADMSETDFSEEDEAGLLAAAIADEDDEDIDELVTAI